MATKNKDKISFREFLSRYTNIPEKIIDEYTIFFEACEVEHYGILLDSVIKFLQISDKQKFYKMFNTNYRENIDYIKKNITTKTPKTTKTTKYYIELDTFEKLCMITDTAKGDVMRNYFISYRKLIDYYKNDFANAINIKAYKNPNKCVYIITTNKKIKYGFTNKGLRTRFTNYITSTGIHPDVNFILVVDNPKEVESCVKAFVKKYEIKPRHEIVHIRYDMLKRIMTDCAQLSAEYNNMPIDGDLDTYIVFNDIFDNDEEPSIVNISHNDKVGYQKMTKKNTKLNSKSKNTKLKLNSKSKNTKKLNSKSKNMSSKSTKKSKKSKKSKIKKYVPK